MAGIEKCRLDAWRHVHRDVVIHHASVQGFQRMEGIVEIGNDHDGAAVLASPLRFLFL